MFGWLEVAATELAPQNGHRLLDAFGDVNLRANAIDAHVCGVGCDGDTTQATQTAVRKGEMELIRAVNVR